MTRIRPMTIATWGGLLAALSLSVNALPGPAPRPTGATTPSASVTAIAGTATAAVTGSPDDLASTTTEPPGRRTALVSSLTLKVPNPKETRKQLQARAAALGGFSVLVTDRELHVKVPPRSLSALVDGISEEGVVVDKSLERSDLTLEIAKLEAQLKSKRSILAELRGFFDGSDVAATLEIERSMTTLVDELEGVKGQLRVLYDRADWAVVHIAFEFKERQRITEVTSPFEWLNSVNLPRFLSEF